MLVALGVENRGSELLAVGCRLARVERVCHDVDHIGRRVQVDRRRYGRGGFRRQVRRIDTQVGQHAVDDLAVGIHTVALHSRRIIGVGDVAVLVDLERTGTGIG
ncbi:hypothetical protein D3C81_1981670 [compost metagenome]